MAMYEMGSTEVRFKYIPGTDDTIGSPLPLTDFLDLNYLAVLSCAFSSTSLESELRNEVSSLNMHLKDFLGKKSNRYLEWRDNFTMQIYNLNRMNPVPFIDNLLKELTEPYNEDISTRLEDLASKVLKMLDRQPPPTQGLIDLMPTDIDDENDIEVGTILSERFIRAFMWLVFHMSNEESTSDTLERVVLLLDELHMYYGKIHSIYHFIEYIYIGLEVIAKNESQSDKELLIDFENHLLVFCNKGESARQLFYLELVDDPSPNTNEIDVLVVRLFDDLYSKSSKDSIVFLWKDTFNMINYISDAILSTRDLVIEVSKSINISKREAENILLHSFFKERKNTKSSYLQRLVIKFKNSLELINDKKDDIDLDFKQLKMIDLLIVDGKIRLLLEMLVGLHDEIFSRVVTFLGLQDIKEVDLSKVKHSDLLQGEIDDYKPLIPRYKNLYKNPNLFKKALTAEMRIKVQTVKYIKDDFDGFIAFEFSDKIGETLLGVLEHAKFELNKQKTISHKSLLRINKCTNIEDLMKLEGDLINTVRDNLANKEKANNGELKSLDNSLHEVIDYHKSILMRKLRFIYVRYSQAVENSINKNNMTYMLFDERESTWKLKVYKLLACIAERQTMESIISRMIDRTRENPWQIHLTEVEETKDVFAEIFGGESTLKNITFGHLVFAAKEFEIVNDTSSSSLTLK